MDLLHEKLLVNYPPRKSAFNEIGGGIAVAAGLFGAAVGYAILGLLGALVGLWTGVTLCGMALEDGRYIRR
jgi:hypothetical protein